MAATLATLTAQVQDVIGDLPLTPGYQAGEDFTLENITQALNWSLQELADKTDWTHATKPVTVAAGAGDFTVPSLRIKSVAVR